MLICTGVGLYPEVDKCFARCRRARQEYEASDFVPASWWHRPTVSCFSCKIRKKNAQSVKVIYFPSDLSLDDCLKIGTYCQKNSFYCRNIWGVQDDFFPAQNLRKKGHEKNSHVFTDSETDISLVSRLQNKQYFLCLSMVYFVNCLKTVQLVKVIYISNDLSLTLRSLFKNLNILPTKLFLSQKYLGCTA